MSTWTDRRFDPLAAVRWYRCCDQVPQGRAAQVVTDDWELPIDELALRLVAFDAAAQALEEARAVTRASALHIGASTTDR